MEWLLSLVLAMLGMGLPVPDKMMWNLPPIRQDANGNFEIRDIPGYDGGPITTDRLTTRRGDQSTNMVPIRQP